MGLFEKKITTEMAEKEFERFCESWEIDTDVSQMNEEDSENFNRHKTKIIKATETGRIIYTDDDKIEYFFKHPEKARNEKSIVLDRPNGGTYAEMDKFKKDESMKKTYAILAGMSKKDISFFYGIDGIDFKFISSIATLFLAS